MVQVLVYWLRYKRVIELVIELRTLEKWYSTYIIRFIQALKLSDRLYTSFNSEGAVSGRVTSDFQQFPKYGITKANGEELYVPRRLIQVSDGEYDSLVFLDYSQIELRVQDLYTILLGSPDLNLSRAYMPYRCSRKPWEPFDFNNSQHVAEWNSNEWYYDEQPDQIWTPTDLHGATTKLAFHIDEDDPRYKKLRGDGKRCNFAKNYGAKYNKIKTMFPDKTEEEVKRIDDAYYTAFPGVKQYHEYCYASAQMCAYTPNLFGIRYYGVNGHKLINLLVQGSAAYYLKLKIRELYDYSKANNLKTRWQMQIHDELSWERWEDETDVFYAFKQIMEDWPDALVPIVAEMDISTTTWADKKGVDYLDELRTRLIL
jgi:DNA polymerase-1